MTNLLEKIIVCSMATATFLTGCAATGPNVKKERRLSPKFGYEQIERNSDSYTANQTYCPNGFVEPLTGRCISLEPPLEPVASTHQNECLPPRSEYPEYPYPNNPFPWPQPNPWPPSVPRGISYSDSKQGIEEKPRCCCPLGVYLPCCSDEVV